MPSILLYVFDFPAGILTWDCRTSRLTCFSLGRHCRIAPTVVNRLYVVPRRHVSTFPLAR